MKLLALAAACLFAFAAHAEEEEGEALLLAHVEAAQQGRIFTYTVVNDEPKGSPYFITAWGLVPHAAFTITRLPEGWKCETDNISYLDCANTDEILPYTHDAGPGEKLTFVLETKRDMQGKQRPYAVTGWSHVTDTGGPGHQGEAIAPYDVALPEEMD